MRFVDSKAPDGYHCAVDYSNGQFTVTVTSPEGKSLSESFGQTWTPTFGMDVADAQQANEIAERLAVSLGAKPYEAPTP